MIAGFWPSAMDTFRGLDIPGMFPVSDIGAPTEGDREPGGR